MTEERILVIQLRQLGDILLTTPVLKAIKRERPKAHLTFLSHGMGRLVLDQSPCVDEHFTYSDDFSKMQEWQLSKTLKERRFDLVLDFMNNPRSAFYALRAGGERWAFRSARRPAYSHVVPKAATAEYIVREKFRLLEAAGFAPADEKLVLPWFEAHTQPLMRMYAREARFREAPIKVILSPTHRREVRQWPLANYAELADRLTKEWGALVLWLHGPGEEAVVDEAMAHCRQPTLKAPKTNFREMAALIGNVDLFVGNSNGPSHVAVAANICSLQLHGPTNAISWCPMTERHQALQAPEFGKSPAPRMASITVDAAWTKLATMQRVVAAFAAEQKPKRPRLLWKA